MEMKGRQLREECGIKAALTQPLEAESSELLAI
jgi:hypothetical protein